MSLLMALAMAQLASSPGYRLSDCAFAAGGGGGSSTLFAAFDALPSMSGGLVTSANHRATFGFLEGWDPQPTNAPVIFAITPDAGPTAGGTPVAIAGLNFNKLGAAPVTVSIAGAAASSVVVASDTLVTCSTPAAPEGAGDVTVTSSFGSDTLAAAFHHSSHLEVYGTGSLGCTGSQLLGASTLPKIDTPGFHLLCDHAPPSSLGLLLAGDRKSEGGADPFGLGVLLHVELLTSTFLLSYDMPSDAAGLGVTPSPIPNQPALIGTQYFLQALWVWGGVCALPPYNLSTSRGLAVTIE